MKPTVHFKGQRIDPDVFFRRYLQSAAALRACGVGEGDVVALMLPNSPLALELTLAARWIGAHWCPVNWHFKTDEVQHILTDSGAKIFIAEASLLAGLEGLKLGAARSFATGSNAPSTATTDATPTHIGGTWESFREASTARQTEASTPQTVLQSPPRSAMFYTSGTTGRPKGIRRAASTPQQVQAGLALLRHCMGFEPGMRALVSAPMYHSAPNSYAIGSSLESAELFIEERFDAEDTLRMIDQLRLTHAYLVPTMYVRMLRLPEAVRQRYDLSSMKFVGSTGSPCPPDVKRQMIEWWGPVIHESYGSSELGYMTRLDSEEALRKPASAGKALPGVRIEILGKNGEILPAGQAGPIYVHHSALADFTYNGNDAARRAMEVNGLKTMGDIGYLDEDGFLFIVDRLADMVISGGVNIYPAEIEAALQMMPGVADCAVFGIPDDEFGETLACAIQPSVGAALQVADIEVYLGAKLARYKLPRHFTFHDALPREDTGKIFKRKLREPYWVGKTRQV